MTVSHPLAQPLRARAANTAHRLLCGAGIGTVVAYRIDPDRCIDVLAHGLTRDGSLVVALPSTALPQDHMEEGHVHEVRMDVRREANEAAVRITSASVHLLGQLSWLSPDELTELVSDDRLSPAAAMLAGSSAAQWARVVTERVVLHDASGVTPFDFGAAAAERTVPFSPLGELDAHDVVRTQPHADLAAICRAVREGTVAGRVQSDRPSPPSVCDHTADRVYCVDVDDLGVNLMHVGRERTTVVFAAFDQQVGGLDGLATQVRSLASRARRAVPVSSRMAQRGW